MTSSPYGNGVGRPDLPSRRPALVDALGVAVMGAATALLTRSWHPDAMARTDLPPHLHRDVGL